MARIAVVGAGHVGAHVTARLMDGGLAEEIILCDIDREKAVGQAMDLNDRNACNARDVPVRAGTSADIAGFDIAVMSACGDYFEEDRLRELAGTRRVADDVCAGLTGCGFHGIVISISNPCDLIAQYIAERTRLPVIGTGTMLDSGRLRVRIARELGVAGGRVEAFMLGEHGDSQIACWTSARLDGLPLGDQLAAGRREAVERDVVAAGWEIARRKGCTEFGIGAAAAELIRAIVNDERRILPCSFALPQEYGADLAGVYASVPRVIGARGVIDTPPLHLSDSERAGLEKSVAVLKRYL